MKLVQDTFLDTLELNRHTLKVAERVIIIIPQEDRSSLVDRRFDIIRISLINLIEGGIPIFIAIRETKSLLIPTKDHPTPEEIIRLRELNRLDIIPALKKSPLPTTPCLKSMPHLPESEVYEGVNKEGTIIAIWTILE